MSDLTKRLRGIYEIPVNDGAGPLDGKNTFTRTFDNMPPICIEAADRIDALEECLREFRKAAKVIATGDLSTALIVSEIVARADALLEE